MGWVGMIQPCIPWADLRQRGDHAHGPPADGLVPVPNCDKIVPGMVMAAVRMDVPAVVCSGGPMLAGTYGGEEVSLSKMFEAVGAYKAGV